MALASPALAAPLHDDGSGRILVSEKQLIQIQKEGVRKGIIEGTKVTFNAMLSMLKQHCEQTPREPLEFKNGVVLLCYTGVKI